MDECMHGIDQATCDYCSGKVAQERRAAALAPDGTYGSSRCGSASRKGCGAWIRWAKTVPGGRSMPFDPEPSSLGNVRLLGDGQCEVLGKRAVEDDTSGALYLSHFVSCPERQRFDRTPREVDHTCHASRCPVKVPPALFMCGKHWRALPHEMQDAIYASYVPGQEQRMDPTRAYLDAAADAIRYLDEREAERRKPKPEQGSML